MYAPSVSGWFRGFREMVSSGRFLACFALFLAVRGRQMAIAADSQINPTDVENSIKTIL
jgi:hypothetical protein